MPYTGEYAVLNPEKDFILVSEIYSKISMSLRKLSVGYQYHMFCSEKYANFVDVITINYNIDQ
jgi:hypothetical protein